MRCGVPSPTRSPATRSPAAPPGVRDACSNAAPVRGRGAEPVRLNLGCGPLYLEGWVNVDADPEVRADHHGDAIEFVRRHAAEVTEVYMGHFLEHLRLGDALALLILIRERLEPGAVVSAVTPDMRAIFDAYLRGEMDNQFLNDWYIYSYVQPSHHNWCHDVDSLAGLFARAGLVDVEPIDIATWEPVYYKSGPNARWQCGVRGSVPRRTEHVPAGHVPLDLPEPEPGAVPAELAARFNGAGEPRTAATSEALLADLRLLQRRLDRAREKLTEQKLHLDYEVGRRDIELAQLRRRLDDFESSPSVRAGLGATAMVRRLVPRGSRQRRLLDSMTRRLR